MLKGGHFVNSKIIERRYTKSLENLKQILPLVDNAYIFDNSNGLKLLATKENGTIEVKDNAKWFSDVLEN